MANKKKIKERELKALAEQQQHRDTFRAVDARLAKAANLTPEIIGELIFDLFRPTQKPLRDWKSFARSLKTRDHDRIALAYLLHMYTDYKVPAHIQQVMLDMRIGDDVVRKDYGSLEPQDRWTQASLHRPLRGSPVYKEREKAFFIVGQGRSLYKELLKDKLTKKEVHVFLTCPHAITYDEALVYAMAKSFTDNNGMALRMAKTRAGRGEFSVKIGTPLFRETIRFFCTHEMPVKEINDLCDYIFRRAVMTEDDKFNHDWSYRGRSPAALTKQMNDWHYELRRSAAIGGGNWDGLPVADASYKFKQKCLHSGRDKVVEWKIAQIRTGNDLAKEGTAMHHCVGSYKPMCIAGKTGIFSLTSSDQGMDCWSRNLTIEVTTRGYHGEHAPRIVQVRGFANRAPKPEERKIVMRWAEENRIDMRTYY